MFYSDNILAFDIDGDVYCPDCIIGEIGNNSDIEPIHYEDLAESSSEDIMYCSICGDVIWYDALRSLEDAM